MAALALAVTDLAIKARAESRTLLLETNSGTIYHLKPVGNRGWDVVRMPEDPNAWTIHAGVPVFNRGSELFIGPWHTTGLAMIQLV